MERVLIENPSQFDAALESALNKGGKVFAYLSSDRDASGNLWCPDCVNAEPVIEEAFAGLGDKASTVTFLECRIERSAWKSPDHPYRTSSLLKLTNIPTLFHITKEGSQGCLVEIDCFDDKLVKEFIQKAF